MAQRFVPMSEVLKTMADEELLVVRGYDKGRRIHVTINDIVKMSDKKRADVARRVLNKAK